MFVAELTNDVEILFQRGKGCVQIASNETNAICYEKNMIKRINLKTEKSDILYNRIQNKTENIYLQGPYLLVAGENKYIQYDAAYWGLNRSLWEKHKLTKSVLINIINIVFILLKRYISKDMN